MDLHTSFQKPWIADFRDPWNEIHYLRLAGQTRLARYLHQRIEKRVVNNSTALMTVSQGIKEQLKGDRTQVLYNGYEPEHFEGLEYHREERFRIKYIGRITAGQELIPMLEYVVTALEGRELDISLVGTNLKAGVLEQLRKQYPMHRFVVKGFVQHRQALDEMVNAEVLLLTINSYAGNSGMLTTKLFEYCGSRTPILCYGPKAGEAAQIIETYQAGRTIADSEDADGGEFLRHLYVSWEAEQPVRTSSELEGISIGYKVRDLLSLLSDVVNSKSNK